MLLYSSLQYASLLDFVSTSKNDTINLRREHCNFLLYSRYEFLSLSAFWLISHEQNIRIFTHKVIIEKLGGYFCGRREQTNI